MSTRFLKALAINVLVLLASVTISVVAQIPTTPPNRILYNNQQIFSSGANIAWVNFARDIGPGTTRLDLFEEMFEEVRDAGGNTMRFWLHTDGSSTPSYNAEGLTNGPGQNAIEDLRAILDLAWEREIGLVLCLWSHDMLRSNKNETIKARNRALLTDSLALDAYIQHALIPMVDSLKGHPGILAWEVFNEGEGITNEFGWNNWDRVPMKSIQIVTNRVAGAIRRTDPNVLITNGTHGGYTLRDSNGKASGRPATAEERREAAAVFEARYGVVPTEETIDNFLYLQRGNGRATQNYYRDDRLIAIGGDSLGTLDFYNFHFYGSTTDSSPFHQHASYWTYSKPIAIGEFFMVRQIDVPWADLYQTLFEKDYAGAWGWQWYDQYANREGSGNIPAGNWDRLIQNVEAIYALDPAAVDVINGSARIASFTVSHPEVAIGDSVRLAWDARNSQSTSLNGQTVAAVGTQYVYPTTDSTFTLVAIGEDERATESAIFVRARPAEAINRLLFKPVVASASEAGFGYDDPAAVTDGDLTTRWSSPRTDGPHSVTVRMDKSVELRGVQLDWHTGYGKIYRIEGSNDNLTWTTLHEVTDGDGVRDSLSLDAPAEVQFVRMVGIDRGSFYGYSLWEMAAFGVDAKDQPPVVDWVTTPDSMAELGSPFKLHATATDAEGAIARVEYRVDDEVVATASAAPWEGTWVPDSLGYVSIRAVAFDAADQPMATDPLAIRIIPNGAVKVYEAENAALIGGPTVQPDDNAPGASGNQFVYMQQNGQMIWSGVTIPGDGPVDLTFRYYLPFDYKEQILSVDGVIVDTLVFNTPVNTWQDLTVTVPMTQGVHTITIDPYWGWMYFDYMKVDALGIVTTREQALPGDPDTIGHPYPNPTRGGVVRLPLETSATRPTNAKVFDVLGRQVATIDLSPSNQASTVITIDTESWSPGVYFVRIQQDGQVTTRSITRLP